MNVSDSIKENSVYELSLLLVRLGGGWSSSFSWEFLLHQREDCFDLSVEMSETDIILKVCI